MSITYVILLLYLGVETDTDIKRREVSVLHFGIVGVSLFLIGILKHELGFVLSGMAPGLLIMVLSRILNGAIGLGDGMVLMICGMVVGLKGACTLFLLALLIMMPVSLWKIVVKKVPKEEEIAFLPFLLAAYICVLLMV